MSEAIVPAKTYHPPFYPRLCAWENLLLAYRKAAKGKRGRPPAASFEHRLEDNLITLQAELRHKAYCPGPYDSFYIHEPKRRLISAAPFRDRVVHHALCNIVEPTFERSFIVDSYANRVGKGTHRALDRAQDFARRYRYVLQCDVRQFFPAIDHAILLEILTRKITDQDVMWLVERILGSGVGVLAEAYEMVHFPGDDLLATLRPRGLPIGNLTSQFWANRSQQLPGPDAPLQALPGRHASGQGAPLPAIVRPLGLVDSGAVPTRRSHGRRNGQPARQLAETDQENLNCLSWTVSLVQEKKSDGHCIGIVRRGYLKS